MSTSHHRIKVGLMGFGRIGRNFYRLVAEAGDIEIVAISDLGRPDILNYLLQRDSIHGTFSSEAILEGDVLKLEDGSQAKMISAVEPKDAPWNDFDIDVVVDATGKYTARAQMQQHIDSGAPRVIISNLPSDEIDRVVIIGVNDGDITAEDRLVSAGSSTTHAAALLLAALSSHFDVERAMMTSVHAFTSDQPLQDMAGKDFRRSRSAAENIIPNESPTPQWIGTILPQFADRFEGMTLNVPVADGSYIDLTIRFNRPGTTVEQINSAMVTEAARIPDILAVTDDPIVSSDIIGNTHSVVFDQQATMVTQRRMAKIIGWYDNGWGHAARILDTLKAYDRLGAGGAA